MVPFTWIQSKMVIMDTNHGEFTSPITSRIGFSSSRLCLEEMENTRMNACPGWRLKIRSQECPPHFLPLDMDSLCMAGNWWLPVVSVICRVQTDLLLEMTFLQE